MRLRLVLTALVLAPLAGCGGPSYAPVSGRVTLDGRPLPRAVVTFLPVATDGIAAAGPGSMAVTDEQGQFTLRVTGDGRQGVLVGEHRVRISTREAVIEEEEGKTTTPRELVPARYNSNTELRFTVPPDGSSAANFELKSR